MKQWRIDIPSESDRVEWKESLGEWKEIIETYAAFATARGFVETVFPKERKD